MSSRIGPLGGTRSTSGLNTNIEPINNTMKAMAKLINQTNNSRRSTCRGTRYQVSTIAIARLQRPRSHPHRRSERYILMLQHGQRCPATSRWVSLEWHRGHSIAAVATTVRVTGPQAKLTRDCTQVQGPGKNLSVTEILRQSTSPYYNC